MDFNDDENIEWLMESSKTVEKVVENDDDFQQREQESIELCKFLQVLRTCFENEPILVESKAKGTVKSEEDFQKLMKKLKVLGYFFSVRTSERKIDRHSCKLMIVNKKNPPSIHPYRVLSHTRYCCSHRNGEKREENMKITKGRRVLTCKAIMDIREIEIFTSVSLSKIRRKRIEELKKFRRSLVKNPDLEGDVKFGVVISLPKTHNHAPRVKGQYLNDEVKAAMHYILRSGTTTVEEIQEKIYQIVDREFENDSIKPSRDNSAFYPNQKTIYNHLRRDGLVVKRVYKKNSSALEEWKNRTKNLLNSIVEAVDNCNSSDLIYKIYKKTEIIANELKTNVISEECPG